MNCYLKKVVLTLGAFDNLGNIIPSDTPALTLPQAILQERFHIYNYILLATDFDVLHGSWLIKVVCYFPNSIIDEIAETLSNQGAEILKIEDYVE